MTAVELLLFCEVEEEFDDVDCDDCDELDWLLELFSVDDELFDDAEEADDSVLPDDVDRLIVCDDEFD